MEGTSCRGTALPLHGLDDGRRISAHAARLCTQGYGIPKHAFLSLRLCQEDSGTQVSRSRAYYYRPALHASPALMRPDAVPLYRVHALLVHRPPTCHTVQRNRPPRPASITSGSPIIPSRPPSRPPVPPVSLFLRKSRLGLTLPIMNSFGSTSGSERLIFMPFS